jgi:hypothetical protein
MFSNGLSRQRLQAFAGADHGRQQPFEQGAFAEQDVSLER